MSDQVVASTNDWKLWLLVLAFAPSLFMVFVYHNDINFWMDPFWTRHVEAPHLVFYARPLGAFLLDIQTNLIRLVPDELMLNAMRFLSLLFVVGIARILDRFLREQLNLSDLQRKILFVGTFIQPSWLLVVMWVSNFVPCILAHFLSLLAAWILLQSRKAKGAQNFKVYLLVGVLLVCCVLIYPAATCAFFWFPCLFLMFQRSKENWSYALRCAILFGVFAGLALLLHKFLLRDVICGSWTDCHTGFAEDSKEYSLMLTPRPFEKIEVLSDIFGVLGSSWLSFFNIGFNTLNLGMALYVIAACFQVGPRPQPFWRHLWGPTGMNLTVFLIFELVMNSPNLVTTAAVIKYRTLCTGTLLIGVGFCRWLQFFKQRQAQNLFFYFSTFLLLSGSLLAGYQQMSRYRDGWEATYNDPRTPQICASGKTYYPYLMGLPAMQIYAKNEALKPALDVRDFDHPVIAIGSLAAFCHLRGYQ